jgi:hypothetical protein
MYLRHTEAVIHHPVPGQPLTRHLHQHEGLIMDECAKEKKRELMMMKLGDLRHMFA